MGRGYSSTAESKFEPAPAGPKASTWTPLQISSEPNEEAMTLGAPNMSGWGPLLGAEVLKNPTISYLSICI